MSTSEEKRAPDDMPAVPRMSSEFANAQSAEDHVPETTVSAVAARASDDFAVEFMDASVFTNALKVMIKDGQVTSIQIHFTAKGMRIFSTPGVSTLNSGCTSDWVNNGTTFTEYKVSVPFAIVLGRAEVESICKVFSSGVSIMRVTRYHDAVSGADGLTFNGSYGDKDGVKPKQFCAPEFTSDASNPIQSDYKTFINRTSVDYENVVSGLTQPMFNCMKDVDNADCNRVQFSVSPGDNVMEVKGFVESYMRPRFSTKIAVQVDVHAPVSLTFTVAQLASLRAMDISTSTTIMFNMDDSARVNSYICFTQEGDGSHDDPVSVNVFVTPNSS